MDTVTYTVNVAETKQFVAPQDIVLVGVQSITKAAVLAVVSWDPNVTTSAFTTALVDVVDANVIGSSNGPISIFPEPVPVSTGRAVFVAISGQGAATIFYRPQF